MSIVFILPIQNKVILYLKNCYLLWRKAALPFYRDINTSYIFLDGLCVFNTNLNKPHQWYNG
jgi:hypothetical protein